MTTLRFNTKSQLIDALEARRAWAVKLDAKSTAAHRKAEAKALALFKKRCREALKWDYPTLKRNSSSVGLDYREKPSCPAARVAQLDQILRHIRTTGQERFVITDQGTWSHIHHFLTFDENAKPSVC